MTSQQSIRNCDGGHICHPPKDCCKQGCCYDELPIQKQPAISTTSMLPPMLLGHWYIWAVITAVLAGILCACSLWRRHTSGGFCCRDSSRDERASEPDSNGSCYAPPQYSRCSSFHQAPPPYSEVTSKPDLYPLVISYNGDTVVKTNGTSTGYLMVQYFTNFLVRPVGSLSATSTIDSLSSSFICNATNEANTIIPPPYSCMGSFEEINSQTNLAISGIGGSLPNSNNPELPSPTTTSPSSEPQATNSSAHSSVHSLPPTTFHLKSHSNHTTSDSIAGGVTTTIPTAAATTTSTTTTTTTNSPKHVNNKMNKKLNFSVLSKNHSVDSESDEHNFSDLLNLSVCMPSSVTHLASGTQSNPQMDMIQSYSVTNSMTSSDISSLANLGTPDSPPRATSPTLEMRELLDKIQQLPQHKSPLPPDNNTTTTSKSVKKYFNRSKAKTLYMPLHEGHLETHHSSSLQPPISCFGCAAGSNNNSNSNNKHQGFSFSKTTRGWLSRSAPSTPCGTFMPNFPSAAQKKASGSQKGSKSKIYDGSPLLHEHDESDEDGEDADNEPQSHDQCL